MIIICNNCNKKFEVEPSIIPEKGRLLQCNSCDNQWFFKKPTQKNKELTTQDEPKNEIEEDDKSEIGKIDSVDENIEEKDNIKIKTKTNILSKLIVFIISIVALIILVDTFKFQLISIIPNIEFILNSLYETIKDVFLFLNDLFI